MESLLGEKKNTNHNSKNLPKYGGSSNISGLYHKDSHQNINSCKNTANITINSKNSIKVPKKGTKKQIKTDITKDKFSELMENFEMKLK